MKHLLYVLLSLPVLATSCDKTATDGGDQPRVPCASVAEAPPAFLRYWYFPTGSWWVYQLKDSVPAVYDTVRLGTDREFRQPYDPGGAQPCVWMYYGQFRHSNRTYFPGPPLMAGGPPQQGTESLYSFTGTSLTRWGVSHTSEAGFYPAEACFIYPFIIGQPVQRHLVSDTLKVTVPAGTFARTVHIQFNPTVSAPTDFSYITDCWWVYGAGIVKRTFSVSQSVPLSGTTWELINYHIAP